MGHMDNKAFTAALNEAEKNDVKPSAKSLRSIRNATTSQHQERNRVMGIVRDANIGYLKLYSNMSHGRLRVKLFGLHRYDERDRYTHLDFGQLSLLFTLGFKVNDLRAHTSAVKYIA